MTATGVPCTWFAVVEFGVLLPSMEVSAAAADHPDTYLGATDVEAQTLETLHDWLGVA